MTTETIHVELLDEGTKVARPTQGVPLGGNVYRVLATPNYNPDDEQWEFPPGSIVRCYWETWQTGRVLLARELVTHIERDGPPNLTG